MISSTSLTSSEPHIDSSSCSQEKLYYWQWTLPRYLNLHFYSLLTHGHGKSIKHLNHSSCNLVIKILKILHLLHEYLVFDFFSSKIIIALTPISFPYVSNNTQKNFLFASYILLNRFAGNKVSPLLVVSHLPVAYSPSHNSNCMNHHFYVNLKTFKFNLHSYSSNRICIDLKHFLSHDANVVSWDSLSLMVGQFLSSELLRTSKLQ